eukprot:CAMPEP_0205940936 /NCGR_PEP_ID=MMETSP1325-20131115/53623_1 /ASSEMBLY_ACC=CAM_ASM_000708 /TAXON_ID=236786 /ORGANISM="Florenciella sp., Strain RCC1007" /LENGTH=60 /DNA_ID=CAMNT_0053311535 /DNA_START=61 /DNA_END=239 /DNA_ORIENTATION=+
MRPALVMPSCVCRAIGSSHVPTSAPPCQLAFCMISDASLSDTSATIMSALATNSRMLWLS